jgi:hypothetical protein
MAIDILLGVMGELYSKHYFTTHEAIPKDSNQLYLLLNNYKVNQLDMSEVESATSQLTVLLVLHYPVQDSIHR